jgi:glutamate synthase (NADH)
MGRVSSDSRVERDPQDTVDDVERSVFPYQETPQNKSWASALPLKQGLYDPELEKDACGVGFAA